MLMYLKKIMMTKIIPLFLFLFVMVACSVAQPSKYGSTDKKAIKFYELARTCFNEVNHLTGRRNLECAEENLLKTLERDPAFIEAHMLLSNVYIEQRNFEKAIAQKETMFAIGKPYSEAEFFYMASLNMAIGDYQKCLKYAKAYSQIRNPNQNMLNKCYKYIADCEFAIAAKKQPVKFNPINLGPNVNTDRPEYFPSITADDKTLLFTRDVLDQRAIHGGHQEDIFVTTTPLPNQWEFGKGISANINTPYNEGAPTFSADGKYVILVGCETGNKGEYDYGDGRTGLGSCDLFVSEKIGDNWTKPANMGTPINSSHFESQPSFSSDGKTLYFIRGIIQHNSLRQTQDQDIYKCEILPDGTWSKPEKLGSHINTPGREESVQIHPDGQTLYFSSDGHVGMGGLDIYMCRLQSDGTWGKPVNLGYPINTHNDENSLLVSSNGDIAFFASDRDGGYGSLDLYQFDLPQHLQPIKTTFMKGVVYDSITKAPLAADFQLIDLSNDKVYKRAIANSGNGEFMVALPSNKSFALIAEHEGYFFYSKNYDITKLQQNSDGFFIDVPMQPIKGSTSFVLENIFFDVDKSILKPESITELNKLKVFLNMNSSLKVELGGHTDSDGNAAHNLKLSDDRAKAVKDWLINNGIDASRLSHKGYGATKPRVPNDSAENKAKNRRTEVMIK